MQKSLRTFFQKKRIKRYALGEWFQLSIVFYLVRGWDTNMHTYIYIHINRYTSKYRKPANPHRDWKLTWTNIKNIVNIGLKVISFRNYQSKRCTVHHWTSVWLIVGVLVDIHLLVHMSSKLYIITCMYQKLRWKKLSVKKKPPYPNLSLAFQVRDLIIHLALSSSRRLP